jgi:hypothetical protein
MHLYEYVLEADDRLDLAVVEVALAWLRDLPIGQWAGPPESGRLPLELSAAVLRRSDWSQNMFALRSVVHRMKGRRSRRPYPRSDLDLRQADLRFRYYVGKLQVGDDAPIEQDPRAARRCWKHRLPMRAVIGPQTGFHWMPTLPMADETGKLLPGLRVPIDLKELLGAGRGFAPALVLDNGPDFFWQSVYLTILAGDMAPPLCELCGQFLKPSKTGLRSRRERCPRCNLKLWRADQRSRKGGRRNGTQASRSG